jgi:hypothetical protein
MFGQSHRVRARICNGCVADNPGQSKLYVDPPSLRSGLCGKANYCDLVAGRNTETSDSGYESVNQKSYLVCLVSLPRVAAKFSFI